MKNIAKLLIITNVVAFASAQTVIDITGSTAGRGAATTGILNTLQNITYAHDHPSSVLSANRAIFRGTFGGNQYIVRTYWAGSVNGVRDVALQTPQSQLLDTSIVGLAGGISSSGVPTGGQPNVTGPLTTLSANENKPEFGFSDVFQSSTAFTTPSLVVEDEVGIIPFKWFKNEGASANLTNITAIQARAIYATLGEAPLSLLTGIASDEDKTVYVTGRNPDSGSRITVMADIGLGVFSPLSQYQFTTSNGVITGRSLFGNNGYPSGGNYTAILGSTYTDGIIVSYLGSTDWAAAAGAGAVELAYNGVPYSVQAVQQGQYSLWGYLHMNRMTLTGNALAFYNAVKAQMLANPGPLLIKDDANMTVERLADGAIITKK